MSTETSIGGTLPPNEPSISPTGNASPTGDMMRVVTLSNATSALHNQYSTSQQLGIRGKRRLSTKKIRLVSPPVSGVAPGIAYDRTIDLIFDDSEVETVKLAAVMEVQGGK